MAVGGPHRLGWPLCPGPCPITPECPPPPYSPRADGGQVNRQDLTDPQEHWKPAWRGRGWEPVESPLDPYLGLGWGQREAGAGQEARASGSCEPAAQPLLILPETPPPSPTWDEGSGRSQPPTLATPDRPLSLPPSFPLRPLDQPVGSPGCTRELLEGAGQTGTGVPRPQGTEGATELWSPAVHPATAGSGDLQGLSPQASLVATWGSCEVRVTSGTGCHASEAPAQPPVPPSGNPSPTSSGAQVCLRPSPAQLRAGLLQLLGGQAGTGCPQQLDDAPMPATRRRVLSISRQPGLTRQGLGSRGPQSPHQLVWTSRICRAPKRPTPCRASSSPGQRASPAAPARSPPTHPEGCGIPVGTRGQPTLGDSLHATLLSPTAHARPN